jgi:hypothetical protein
VAQQSLYGDPPRQPDQIPLLPQSKDAAQRAYEERRTGRPGGELDQPETPEQAMARFVAESDNPVREIGRINAAMYASEMLKVPLEYALANMDEISEQMYGKVMPPESFLENMKQAWDNGMQNYEIAMLAVRLRDTGGTDEALIQQIRDLEANVTPLSNIPRPWIQQAFLWAAESGPLMAQSMLKGGRLGLATGAAAGLTTGAVASPLTGGLSVPAMTMAMASVGFTVGMTQDMIASMRGLAYWRMREQNVPHEIAAPLADIEGIVAGSIESLGSLLLGMKIPGLTPILKSAGSMISSKLVASGVVGQIATRVVSQMVGGALAEGIEEPLQELTAIFTDEIARELAKDSTIEPTTISDVATRLGQAFYTGASAGLVFGIAGVPGGVTGTVQQFNAIKEVATQSTSREQFVEDVGNNENLTDGTSVTQEAWKEYLGDVWDKQHEVKPGATPVPQRIYTETQQVGLVDGGTTQMLKSGDPETGERAGYLLFDQRENEIRIHDVVSEGETDIRRELMLELMARNRGKEIIWDVVEDENTPAAVSNVELRQEMIEGNPRGVEAGLQYFETVDQRSEAQALTSQAFVQKFGETFNFTPQQAQTFAPMVEILARTKGEWEGRAISADEYIAGFVAPEVAREGEAVQQELAAGQGVAATGFLAGKFPIDPMSVDEFKGLTRAVFSATENADFHIGMHEFFHAVERLALAPQQTALLEQAIGKSRDQWTEQNLETLADMFEDYLGSGRAPTAELKTLFQQISDLLWELVSYIRERLGPNATAADGGQVGQPRISPEFEAAYDALFTTQRRQEQEKAPQQAKPETVVEQVIDTIIQPEAQPPEPVGGTTSFDLSVIPIVKIPVSDLVLSKDVPNFKEGANKETGIVEPLTGEGYLTTPPYPIVVWERLDGRLEVITGRHRLELARRLRVKVIPYAQVVREADGFTAEQALTLDAESNIRERTGTVKDYANYFRSSETTEKQASSRGLLDSHKGREGFAIGRHASDGLYTLWRNNRITDTKAAAIASAAIDNEALQAEGIKRSADLDADELINYLNLLKNVTPQNQVEQEDLFGRDESQMVDAANMSKAATRVQRGLKEEYNALKAAVRLGGEKQRKAVEQYGFEAGDTRAMKGRMNDLEDDIRGWTDWTTDPERFAELREIMSAGDAPRLFHMGRDLTEEDRAAIEAEKTRIKTDLAKPEYGKDKLLLGGRTVADARARDENTLAILDRLGDRGVRLNSKSNPQQYRIIHQSTYEGFRWQVSDFDDTLGAMSHEAYRTIDELLRDIRTWLSADTVVVPDPQLALFHKVDPLPPQPKIPQEGQYAAVRTDDGGIYADVFEHATHIEFIKDAGIPPTRIVSGGWIKDGVYEASERSDTMRFVEQEKAKRAVADRRANRLLMHQDTNTPEFKAWFADSKVVDENGEPLVVYHGTGESFTEFDPSKTIGGQFWFTTDNAAIEKGEVGAQGHGVIIEAYLSIQNPAGWAEYDNLMLDEIIQRGHDGLALPDDGATTYVVFEPTQIKSVNNRGTYDQTSPNILMHKAIEGPALMAKKAKKLFGTTEDPNEAGYILPSGEMLDFSGRNFGRVTGGDRGMDHRAIWQEGAAKLGLTSKEPTKGMYEWMRKSGSVRLKGFDNAEIVGVPTPAALRTLAKAMKDAPGEIHVVLMNERGNTETAWSGMHLTAGAIQTWLTEQSRSNVRVSTLMHAAPDPWILKSVELLRAKMQGPMVGSQIKAMLNKNGVKPDEMKWLNLEEYLDTDAKLTIDEVLEYIEQNDVKVEEKVLGSGPPHQFGTPDEQAAALERYYAARAAWTDMTSPATGVIPPAVFGTPEYRAVVNEFRTAEIAMTDITPGWGRAEGAAENPAEYDTYALAGGVEGTYGELLLTLPALTPEYQAPHFTKYKNIFVHVRYKLHMMPNGEMVLLLEEVQSDLHQAARTARTNEIKRLIETGLSEEEATDRVPADYGYVGAFPDEVLTAAIAGGMTEEQARADINFLLEEPLDTEGRDTFDKWERLLDATEGSGIDLNEVFHDRRDHGVPNAPFKTTWHELAFRRMLRFATEAGVKRIAWTTGKQQADRYRLSNVVDKVRISKHGDGGWTLKADKGSRPVLSQEANNPKEFIPYVGKDLVAKLVEEIGDKRTGTATVEGLEMDVGGEGMKGFYDYMLVKYAEKYGKKWGASVQDVEIDTGDRSFTNLRISETQDGLWRIIDENEYGIGTILSNTFKSEGAASDALRVMKEKAVSTVHSMNITPEMEGAVSQGQYLFHQADNWQGQFIYGTSIDADVYQTYVDQAKGFDTVEKFQDMMKALYGDLDITDMEITEANRFLAEVFKAAEAQKAGQPEVTGKIKDPELPEFAQYNAQDKYDAARSITDKDLAARFENGEVTDADLEKFVLEAEGSYTEAQQAGRVAEAEDRGRRGSLDSEQQGILDLGDEIDNAIDGLAAMPADSTRRARAETRLKDLYARFRTALFADLETAEELVEEAVWERAVVLRESIQDPDLVGRLGEAGEEAVSLGRDLQKAIDERKLKGEMSKRTVAGQESRARIYAKKRTDVKRARDEIRDRYKNREAARLMRQARIKLMKAIMRPPGKGVEFRGYSDTIRQVQDALDPLAPNKRSMYQKLSSKKFLLDNPDAEIYMTEDWLDNIYAQAHPNFTIADLERINEILQRLREDGRHKRAQKLEAERTLRKNEASRAANAVLRGDPPEEFIGSAKRTNPILAAYVFALKSDRVVQMLQGGAEGVFQEWMQDDVNEAWSLMKKGVRKRTEKMTALMKELKLTLDPLSLKNLAGYTWVGRDLDLGTFRRRNGKKITAQQAMYWSIGMKNDKTRAALLYGNNYPPNIIMAAISQLSPSEQALAAAIGKDYNVNFPRYREAFIDSFNMDLPGEDNYVSMHRLEMSYETRQEQVANEMLGRSGNRKVYVDRAATHVRVEMSDEHQTPIRDDLVTLWMEDVVSQEGFIYQDALLKRLHSIFESDVVKHAVLQKYGPAMNKRISKDINDLAQAEAYQGQSGIEKTARILRSNTAIAYLAFSVPTVLKQLTGPINFLADAGPIDLAWAAAQYLGSPVGPMKNALIAFVDERTEAVRNAKISQEFEDVKRLNQTLYQNILKKIGTTGMKGLEYADRMTRYIGWRAVYNRVLRQTKDEAGAIHAADKAVIRSQPSSRVQDMAAMYRSGEVVKLFTMFTSELSTNFNRLFFDIPVAIKRGHIVKAFGDLIALGMVGAGIAVATGALYKDDDEEKKEAMIRGTLSEYVQTLPFAGRDMGNAVAGQLWDSGVAFLPPLQPALRALMNLEGGDAEGAWKAAAESLALGFGTPYIGVKRAYQAVSEQDLAKLLGWKK